MSVQLQSHPGARQQNRQARDEEPDGVARYGAVHSQPQSTHREYGDTDRLDPGALPSFPPAAHAAPNRRKNAGQSSKPAKNAVEKSHAGIGSRASTVYGLHRWARETVRAEKHQQHADCGADV